MIVTWKTSSWSTQYHIFRDRIITGILKKQAWTRQGYGEFNGAMLRFRSTGFLNSGTVITDIEGERELGTIVFDRWRSTASVIYQGHMYAWKYESWKRNAWMISDQDDFAKYKITNFWKGEGVIEIEGLPPALVLIGLFIQESS
jgi:hypothetical protein